MSKSMPTNVVGSAIKQMRCHAGVVLNGLAVTGFHHIDHKCDMSVTPVGVFVRMHKHLLRPAAELLVPWANIYFVELLEESK